MKNIAFLFLFLSVPLLCVAMGKYIFQQRTQVDKKITYFAQPVSSIPIVTINPQETVLQTNAGSFIVIDVASGVVIAEKNADSLFFPASTAKIMTALLAREIYSPSTIVTVPAQTFTLGDNILRIGSQFSVADLIKASLIPSSNAAAFALAAADPLGTAHFIGQMNAKASVLQLTKTRFDNPIGFDSEYMQTSARDLAVLSKELLKDAFLRETVATSRTTITDLATKKKYELVNTNVLLGYNNQVFGIKTGTTDLAGQVLVSLVYIDGHEVIIVVMESYDRYQDTKSIISWLESHVDWFEAEQL